ncbi:hypothetical protein BGZ61DRAFT_403459 [Ilyonectria robusta]|uniref:uncharacterized protein n=1 Tax=Ilyonectria robusta TaxID=1079257 RepID=UPI001E8CB938|nr:uncharacterized protein BGZ61DRAFT_403459 [Ilyonectria robusta]KAH8659655.1 hypothetical protein BGZ61DRAFT_403459 [Ilyonectria robusta]
MKLFDIFHTFGSHLGVIAHCATRDHEGPNRSSREFAIPMLSPRNFAREASPQFCKGKSYEKRATASDISYKGNIGIDGNYGCNLMLVQNHLATLYDYTVTFTNGAGLAQRCVCWLKIGPHEGINGFFQGNQVLEFSLPGHSRQVLAIDTDSQGGCACGNPRVPVTAYGQFASSWLEFDIANAANGGWSGADASCLVSAFYGLDIPGLQVCSYDVCSTVNPGGTGTNAYIGGMENEDGIGLNIPPGQVQLVVTVGYGGG